jgi:prepilin-type N-terminal cleavage/methylation domain-containing protein
VNIPAVKPGRVGKGFSLIEILVVMVIIVILSAVTYSVFFGHAKGAPPGKAHNPMERAHDTECMNNVHQVHLAIMAAQAGDTDGKNPASLEELKLPKEMLSCPVGHVPYVYDPATGQVHCPYPGHENFQ